MTMRRGCALFALAVLVAGCANKLVLDKANALAALPRQLSDSGHFVVNLELNGRGTPGRNVGKAGFDGNSTVVFRSSRRNVAIEFPILTSENLDE